MTRSDADFMRCALEQARLAADSGETPVGAVVAAGQEVVARARNAPIGASDPTAHAEVLALREAARVIGNYRLTGAVLYVTLEPCAMCFGAAVHARIRRLVFGARDPKSGVLGGVLDLRAAAVFNHRPEVSGGVLAEDCAALLQAFFEDRRERKQARKGGGAVKSAPEH